MLLQSVLTESKCSVLALHNCHFLLVTREKWFIQPQPEHWLLAPEQSYRSSIR